MLRLFFILLLLWEGFSLPLLASSLDECKEASTDLPWSSIESDLFSYWEKKPIPSKEKSFFTRAYTLSKVAKNETYRQESNRLASEIQRFIATERKPSESLKQLWISLLISTDQRKIAFASSAQLGRTPLDALLRTEASGQGPAFFSLDPQSYPGRLSAFIKWRRSNLLLKQGDLTRAYQVFLESQANFAIETKPVSSMFLGFANSRLSPTDFWLGVTGRYDKEWLSICTLERSKSDSALQSAFTVLTELKTHTDLSLHYLNKMAGDLKKRSASPSSQAVWAKLALKTIRTGKFKNTKAKDTLENLVLAEISRLKSSLDSPWLIALVQELEMHSPDLKSVKSLALYRIRADYYERLGEWSKAAACYEWLALKEKSQDLGLSLSDEWLENARKAAPPINSKIAPLAGLEQKKARDYLRACENHARYIGRKQEVRDSCESYGIQFLLNQKDLESGIRMIWLYAAAHPKEAATIVPAFLGMLSQDPARLIEACEKLLLFPSFQRGEVSEIVRNVLRNTKFAQISKLPSEWDQANAFANFAEIERPHPLALQAIEQAIVKSHSHWQTQIQFRKFYLKHYATAPAASQHALAIAKTYEEHFAFPEALEAVKKSYPWQENSKEKDEFETLRCRIEIIFEISIAAKNCRLVAQKEPKLAVDLAKNLMRTGESTQLHGFVMSNEFTLIPFTLDQKIETLSYAFEGLKNFPKLQEDIKAKLYEIYAEKHDDINLASRRRLASMAYEIARNSLDKYLDMPIFANQVDSLVPAIQSKKAAYKELENLYAKVLGTKDAYWGASALADLAISNLDLSAKLNSLPPIEGLDPNAMAQEIRGPATEWTAKGKSYADAASKTLENFPIIHEHAQNILSLIQHNKKDQLTWDDLTPVWEPYEAL